MHQAQHSTLTTCDESVYKCVSALQWELCVTVATKVTRHSTRVVKTGMHSEHTHTLCTVLLTAGVTKTTLAFTVTDTEKAM
jgi:hypothetical protein